jgi:DNA-binding NtrC family response regulator
MDCHGILASTLRLSFHDTHIESVDSPIASLVRIRSIEYTAIICEGHQPRIEGVAFVRGAQRFHPERPVLLLIEKHDQGLIWQAMNAGAYDMLVKSVDEAALLFAVHRAIEASRLLFQVKRVEAKLMAPWGNDERSRGAVWHLCGHILRRSWLL